MDTVWPIYSVPQTFEFLWQAWSEVFTLSTVNEVRASVSVVLNWNVRDRILANDTVRRLLVLSIKQADIDENWIIRNEILLRNLAGYFRLMYPEETVQYIVNLLSFTKKPRLIKLIEEYVPQPSIHQEPKIQIEVPKWPKSTDKLQYTSTTYDADTLDKYPWIPDKYTRVTPQQRMKLAEIYASGLDIWNLFPKILTKSVDWTWVLPDSIDGWIVWCWLFRDLMEDIHAKFASQSDYMNTLRMKNPRRFAIMKYLVSPIHPVTRKIERKISNPELSWRTHLSMYEVFSVDPLFRKSFPNTKLWMEFYSPRKGEGQLEFTNYFELLELLWIDSEEYKQRIIDFIGEQVT